MRHLISSRNKVTRLVVKQSWRGIFVTKKLLGLCVLVSLCLSSYSCCFSQSGLHLGQGQVIPNVYLSLPILGLTSDRVDPVTLVPVMTQAAQLWKKNSHLIEIKTITGSTGQIDLSDNGISTWYTFVNPMSGEQFDLVVSKPQDQVLIGFANPGQAPPGALAEIGNKQIIPLSEALRRAYGSNPPGQQNNCHLKVYPAHGSQPSHFVWEISAPRLRETVLLDASTGQALAASAVYQSEWEKLISGQDGDAWDFHPGLNPAPPTYPLPVYSGSKVLGFQQLSDGERELDFVTPASEDQVWNYYIQFFRATGWRNAGDVETDKAQGTMKFYKGGIAGSLQLMPNNGVTAVKMFYGGR